VLVNLNDILKNAWKNQYAVPAFDCTEDVMIRPILDACEEMRSPVVLMALGHDLQGRGIDYIASIVKGAAPRYAIPVAFHLDHATELELIEQAIAYGFTSVMYDGSMLPFEANAAKTAEVVRLAHAQGVSVEAELGHVAGKELDGSYAGEMQLTDPAEVVRFLETGVDALAVSIGTAHGIYISAPTLNIDRLKAINAVSTVPLVLHGGSGTPEDQLQQAIAGGIAKVNLYADIRIAMMNGVKAAAQSAARPDPLPDELFRPVKEEIRAAVLSKIGLCRSAGRA
jgi:fructose-bisphosphate aldolase class II